MVVSLLDDVNFCNVWVLGVGRQLDKWLCSWVGVRGGGLGCSVLWRTKRRTARRDVMRGDMPVW